MKNLYVLVGPPSVGKSTWIKNNFKDIDPFIISRDDLVENVAKSYGWTYDDLFMQPIDSKEGDVHDKYGTVIKSPAYMTGSPLSYDKVLQANNKVFELFNARIKESHDNDNIVVDMTNMNINSRKSALKVIEGKEDYKKIAVVFSFKGAEDIIKKVSAKRAKEAKLAGKSKTISDEVFDKMFKSFQEIDPTEGFDEVINVNNIDKLKNSLNESRIIMLFEQFKNKK